MKTLLVINSSSRVNRAVTRRLTHLFVSKWKDACPDSTVIQRDVGLLPPPAVSEAWIAAAFASPEEGKPAVPEALALSETLIDEILRADAIVMGVPMYNFGMPAQLKAYFDQIIRIGRTFAFNPEAENPYTPLLPPRPVVGILSAGDGALHVGGSLAHLNFLEPHLATVLGFVGLADFTPIRVGYEEYHDERAARSLAAAETAIEVKVKELMAADCKDEAEVSR